MEIVLEVENLPHPQPGHTGFQCIVTIEGAKMMVPARVESNQFIVCDKTTVSFHTSITKLHVLSQFSIVILEESCVFQYTCKVFMHELDCSF